MKPDKPSKVSSTVFKENGPQDHLRRWYLVLNSTVNFNLHKLDNIWILIVFGQQEMDIKIHFFWVLV